MEKPVGYFMEPEDFDKLKKIKSRLFNLDDKPFKLGEARDLANLMDYVLSQLETVNNL
jgi:hypothetical protein